MKRLSIYGMNTLTLFFLLQNTPVGASEELHNMEAQTVVFDRLQAPSANALVCLDRNQNQTCDDHEPHTRSGQDGSFRVDDLLLQPSDHAAILIVAEGKSVKVIHADRYHQQMQVRVTRQAVQQSREAVAKGADVHQAVNLALDSISDAVFANQARINEKLNELTQGSETQRLTLGLPSVSGSHELAQDLGPVSATQASELQNQINEGTETLMPLAPSEYQPERGVALYPLLNAQASTHCDLNFDSQCGTTP